MVTNHSVGRSSETRPISSGSNVGTATVSDLPPIRVVGADWLNNDGIKVFREDIDISRCPDGKDRNVTFRVRFEKALPIKSVAYSDVKLCSGIEVIFDFVGILDSYKGDDVQPIWLSHHLPYGKDSTLRLSVLKEKRGYTVRRWKNEPFEEEVVLVLRISASGSHYEFDMEGRLHGIHSGMRPMIVQRILAPAAIVN